MNRTPVAVTFSMLCCFAGGCSTRTDVALTGNTPAQYTHLWVTAQEVWFNDSDSAGPGDGGWVKFPLSAPVTFDLVTESSGNLGSIVTALRLTPGTYSQVRLIPVAANAALTSSAQALGALYNAEADYVDSAGTTHQLPLELLNPDQGLGIAGSFKVPLGSVGAALGAVTAGNTTTTPTTPATLFGTPPVTPAANTTSTTNSQTTTVTFAINIDGARDLTPFTYAAASAPNGILLSSHASAFDLSEVGAISGQLTLTNISGTTGVLGQPIEVSAETLSADGSRHVVINSAAVHADGSFLLYPLPTSSSSPASYDVVIHGSGIATLIIKSVQVTLATSGTTSSTTGNTTSTSINSVSIGTLIPRAARTYTANLGNSAATALPAGAEVVFYQTLAASGEVPYAIEASPIDPFNQVLANAQGLSAATIDSGTFASSGASITVVSAAPREGAGRYLVAARAPSYNDGALTASVSAPPSGTTVPVLVTVPGLTLGAGAVSGAVVAAITEASPGKYDRGQLLLSHDGALVATAPLDAALAQGAGATVTLSGLPSVTATSLYYVTARVWNSSDPAGTLQQQSYATPLDLRASATGSVQLTIN